MSGTTLKKPVNQKRNGVEHVCVFCGKSLLGRSLKALYCNTQCRTQAFRSKDPAARKTSPKPHKSTPPAMDSRAPVKREDNPLHQKAPAIPRSTVTYGAVYEGTMLMRRREGSHYVAPVYVGVDTLSLVDRLYRAFADAEKLNPKMYAVVVDGVLYPKIDGKWYVWKRPREVYELTLREMGLTHNEIFFRMSVQRLETAKSDLRAAFGFIPMPPEAWHQYLKWQQTFLEKARKDEDRAREKLVQHRIAALTEAISARQQWLHWSQLVTQKN